MNAGTGNINWWRTLGWAFYLACSWTWCIGMFLPVLLLRDYGFWGFVVFAVPNVIGAGAMGWVLRDGASERIVKNHRRACVAFSLVTIAFHAYFLGWIVVWLFPERAYWWNGWIPAFWIGLLLVVIVLLVREKLATWAAVFTLGLSGIAWAGMKSSQFLDAMWTHLPSATGRPDKLTWLLPVMIFGFGLCPYLDLTFHRARSSQDARGSAIAFSVGFAGPFLGMILLTLCYSPMMRGAWTSYWPEMFSLLMAHMFAQSAFTVWTHRAEVEEVVGKGWWGAFAMFLALLFVAGLSSPGMNSGNPIHMFAGGSMALGEIAYRIFMAFYGLVFPAYVWLLMIPTRDGHSGLGGENGWRKMLIWAGAVGIAAPMFWMGFIERQEFWLVPGLGVALGARLLLPRGAGEARRSSEGSLEP